MKRSHLLTIGTFALTLTFGILLFWGIPAFAKNTPHPQTETVRGWINLAIGALGLAGSIFGGIAWYNGAIEKRFAAQRSFEHLRKNQEQMGQSLILLDTQLDEISHDLKAMVKSNNEIEHELDLIKIQATEAKGVIMATFQQMQILSSKVDGNTGGWSRNEARG